MICEEILKETGECGHYIRSLPHLKICDDDISLKNDLHNLCSKIIAVSKLSNVLKIQFNLEFFLKAYEKQGVYTMRTKV